MYRRGVKIFFIYFGILLLLIFGLWPGIWGRDDPHIIACEYSYWLQSWYHILTGYLHLVALQVFPVPAGVIIVQNFFIALITAYVVVKYENIFNVKLKNAFLDTTFKLLPFLTLPVLNFNFSGMRYCICTFLELLFVCIIIFSIKTKKQWSYKKIIYFSILTALVSNWRSESLMYIPLAIFLFCTLQYIGTLKKRIIGILLTLLLFFSISAYQEQWMPTLTYSRPTALRPGVELIRKAYENYGSNLKLLDEIDKVVDVKEILAQKALTGDALHYVYRDDYSVSEYNNYLKNIGILIVKYPFTFIQERLDNFTLLLMNKQPYSSFCIREFFNPKISFDDDFYNSGRVEFMALPLSHPISFEVRKFILNCIYVCKDDNLIEPIQTLTWTLITPLLSLVFALVYFLVKKYYEFIPLEIAILLKTFIIFLTAPAPYFEYLLYLYLFGYTLLIYFILWQISRRRNNG